MITKRVLIFWGVLVGILLAANMAADHRVLSVKASNAAGLERMDYDYHCAPLRAFANAPYQNTAAEDDGLKGVDVPAVRYVMDPYPSFNGIAVDPENDRVVMSDTNRHSLLVYDRKSGSHAPEITQPLQQIIGPAATLGYLAAVAMDPVSREFYVTGNDAGDDVVVFSYDAKGNVKPKRTLYVPHQAYGVAINRPRNELAVTNQSLNMVLYYRREAQGLEPPLRVIQGPKTKLADPRGIFLDDVNAETVVSNDGSWRESPPSSYVFEDTDSAPKFALGGHFEEPSIHTYATTAAGDVAPLRSIQGAKTQLDWPMGVFVDTEHNEIAVANDGNNSILIFRRSDSGNVAPVRVIQGQKTGINRPMGVAIDNKHEEIWVANFGEHTAAVFARTATGDVAPKRIVRNAPAGSSVCGFGHPQSIAYDSKRDQILVPN